MEIKQNIKFWPCKFYGNTIKSNQWMPVIDPYAELVNNNPGNSAPILTKHGYQKLNIRQYQERVAAIKNKSRKTTYRQTISKSQLTEKDICELLDNEEHDRVKLSSDIKKSNVTFSEKSHVKVTISILMLQVRLHTLKLQ